MTGPERIWINEKWEAYLRPTSDGDTSGYIRRDPAVLAALPEVQALIAAAIEVAAKALDHVANNWDCGHMASRLCDCAPLAEQWGIAAEEVRFLTPADATAALARIVREAEARGMERAAARARVYASNYEQSSDGRNTFILLAEWADAEAAAILARAAEIERDGK